MKTQDQHDEFIRKLISKKGIEKAPDGFTLKVMEQIRVNPVKDDSPLLSTGSWIAIITGLAALIVIIFTVDIPFFDQMFNSSNIEKVSMNILNQGLFDTMAAFFKGLNISSITWMIVAAALGLVVLDRVLRKRFTQASLLII
jgi:hypothetical protein